jgi:sugar lactone lactonase YvrE
MVSGDSKISRILWGAFDANGTLYIAGENAYKTSRIGAILGGCSATSLTILNPGSTIGFPEGVQVDKNGHIAVGDSHGFGQAPSIDVYDPPKAGSHRLTLISQVALSDSGPVSSFAFTKDGTTLYTAEPHYSLEYAYPGGGYSIGELIPPGSGDLIEGVAVTPAESP